MTEIIMYNVHGLNLRFLVRVLSVTIFLQLHKLQTNIYKINLTKLCLI